MDPKSSHKCPYKREAAENHRQKGRRHYDHRGRDWSDVITNQGILATTRSWKRKEMDSVGPTKELHVCQQLILAQWC